MKKTKTEILLRLEKFLVEDLWQHIIVLGSVALCAWLFNRWIQGITFCVSHYAIRKAFDKEFHILFSTAWCICLTLAIAWFAIPITLPLAISLLSSIPIAFGICFVGYVVQDRIDLEKAVKELNNYTNELVKKLSHKDIYEMTEDELYEHCRSCGLDEEDCKIAYFLVIERLHGKELYKALPYAEATIKRKRLKIMAKIQSQPKNVTTIFDKPQKF